MTLWKLIRQSLFHYWRPNLGVMLGVAFCSAVLVGALMVGDTVRSTLKRMVLERLGDTQLALAGQGRYVRSELAQDLAESLNVKVAGILQTGGIAIEPTRQLRLNRVNVYGVDKAFWAMGLEKQAVELDSDEAAINAVFAQQLGVNPGDDIILRVDKSGLLPREIPFAGKEDQTAAMRLRIKCILTNSQMGRFGLKNNQDAVYNLFVSLDRLQEKSELQGKANIILAGEPEKPVDLNSANEKLRRCLRPDDLELKFKVLTKDTVQIQSGRVFLDHIVVENIKKTIPESSGILAYFVNSIISANHSTPYSMIAGIDHDMCQDLGITLEPDDIVVSRWLADDLKVETGDPIRLSYWVLSEDGSGLVEQSHEFKVAGIITQAGDRDMMPDMPGLSDAGNCREWKAGIPIDFGRIRAEDEAYWETYRGTPKALISLETAQKIWGNRWGRLTEIRIKGNDINKFSKKVLGEINPGELGLQFRDVRGPALAGASGQTDFGQLFLGMSMFLIGSALILPAMLFALTVRGRNKQIALLRIIGFETGTVRQIILVEALILVLAGTGLGLLLAGGYAGIITATLNSNWLAVTGTSELRLFISPQSMIGGSLASVLMGMGSVWLALRRDFKRRDLDMLHGRVAYQVKSSRWKKWTGLILTGLAITTMLYSVISAKDATEIFFMSGSLLLAGGIFVFSWQLSKTNTTKPNSIFSMGQLISRGLQRTPGRIQAVAVIVACGVFMVVAVGSSQKNPLKNSEARSSGTGGYALLAQTTIPISVDLDSQEAITRFALDPELMRDVSILSVRVHEGDNAGCLNLNKPVNPAILGISVVELVKNKPFTIVKTEKGLKADWQILEGEGAVTPVITDQSAILWSLGKKLGDRIPYPDQRGGQCELELAGGLNNSILQGYLIISEERFKELFPEDSGYRFFLIDCQPDKIQALETMLQRSLADVGIDIERSADRLGRLYALENTYMTIFMQLGGLGMILGTVGMAVVVFRNVMERRSELALLKAVGFTSKKITAMLIHEHRLAFGYGVGLGAVSALIAVLPGMIEWGSGFPWRSIITILVIILVCGIIWIMVATHLALRGRLVGALRDE